MGSVTGNKTKVMDNILINTDKIVSIKAYCKLRFNEVIYRQRKKRWLLKDKKAGFFKEKVLGGYSRITRKSIENSNKLIIDNNNIVYYKPHIDITMVDGSVHTKFLENEKELRLQLDILDRDSLFYEIM